MTDLRDRLLGCLYGGAAGDALGYAVEFLSWPAIERQYGPEGIREYELRRSMAEVSDDTQMTLFTAEGLTLALENSLPADEAIWACYVDWLGTQGWGKAGTPLAGEWLTGHRELFRAQAPGNTCLSAIRAGVMGRPDSPVNHSCGCGGIMRTAPCGFAPARLCPPDCDPADTAIMLGAQAGAATHGHPMGWIPAGILADIVHRLAFGLSGGVHAAVSDSLVAANRLWDGLQGMDRLTEQTALALALAEEGGRADREAFDLLNAGSPNRGGWLGDDALFIAVYCAARYEHDFDACLRAAVNHSGDSDSTGAIAGNILGARLGLSGLDTRWRKPLDVKPAIDETAERLLRALQA